jgi:hypothetical protein
MSIQVQRATPTLADLASFAPAIFIGKFRSYGETHWSTPDGKRPSSMNEGNNPHLFRDAEFSVEQVLRGPLATGPQVLRMEGGELGCDRIVYTPTPEPVEGQRSVVFLYGDVDTRGEYAAPAVNVVWPIVEGSVITPADGSLPLSNVEQSIAQTPALETLPPVPVTSRGPNS